MIRLGENVFNKSAVEVAKILLGKYICIPQKGELTYYKITETEAYMGMEDKACHASKGRTNRTEVMFRRGGHVYMYLIYGMYWMLNFVTAEEGNPQAVLIRGIEGYDGPGKLTKFLKLDKSYNKEDLYTSNRIYVVDKTEKPPKFVSSPRIGIGYAGEPWVSKLWRHTLVEERP